MNIKKIKEQLQQGTFYYYKSNLFIKSEVTRVVEMEDIFLEISFECGNVDVFIDKIKPVRRPDNIIAKFKWCYKLKNEYDDVIGYIGLKEEI
ncbi:hypothetical protein AWN73_10820 [Clostridium butyricum]|uniref:Uncharacterized protein n=1 Tax=Clostridium butyricum TaxID=1492 RepID=A0A2S7FCS3_CLOBU|nr:hypothetical protein OA81_12785 [Clostridium butyricum]PPV16058.1 hypothetical protein AWN73_10820 [Clostridium butyricum]